MAISKDEDTNEETKAPAPVVNTENRYFKLIEIHPITLNVKITAAQKMQTGFDKENERETYCEVPYSVPAPFQANKDLIAAMHKLTKHGITLMEEDSVKGYKVNGIKMTGSIEERNATLVLHMRKEVAWSDKPATIKTPPFSIFTEGGIPTEDLLKDLKHLFKEAWAYTNGKNAMKAQLALFND